MGRLQKLSDVIKSWRDRYLVLTPDTLTYYSGDSVSSQVPVGAESQEGGSTLPQALLPGVSPKGVFYIVDLTEVRRVPTDKLAFCVALRDRGSALQRSSERAGAAGRGKVPDKELLLRAVSERDRDAWMKDIERAMYSPGRRVAALRAATALLKQGVLCIRGWELARGCIAQGTEKSLSVALELLRRSEQLPARARGSEALESHLVDLALAYSEGALIGTLAGLRRVCAKEVCRSALQERLVSLAISKYGTGRWLGDEMAAHAASVAAAEDQDGTEAAVASLCSGALTPSFLDGAAAVSSPAATAASQPALPALPDAEWTQDVQDAFALTLHTIAATLQRTRVQRRDKRAKESAAAAAAGAAAGAAPPSSGAEGADSGSSKEAAALEPPPPAAAEQVGSSPSRPPRGMSRTATAMVESILSSPVLAAGSAGSSSSSSAPPSAGRSRANTLAIESLFARADMLGDLSLVKSVLALEGEDERYSSLSYDSEELEEEQEEQQAQQAQAQQGGASSSSSSGSGSGSSRPPTSSSSTPSPAGAAAGASGIPNFDLAAAIAELAEEGHLFKEAFSLGEKIGEGGYSQVFRGRHLGSGKEVAVKVTPKQNMDEQAHGRLVYEVATMARLAHPHILALHAFYNEPAAYFIVMELCAGGELFDRIVARKAYTEGQARDTLRTLVSACAFLHSRNIAHRDIKPENILLGNRDDVTADIKLGDLGFAKEVPAGGGLLTSCGTPSYVAPEILQNQKYGCPCDMWSLGVILYILLCGYPPFAEANQVLLFKKIVRGQFSFDAEGGWGAVSPAAKDVVSRLLTVDPAKRATAEEVLAHPWLQGAASSTDLSVARARMGVFNQARRRIVKSGELVKQGGVVRTLHRRTFVLTPEALSYYDPREWAEKEGGEGGREGGRQRGADSSSSSSSSTAASSKRVAVLEAPEAAAAGGEGGAAAASASDSSTPTAPSSPQPAALSAGALFLAALGLGGAAAAAPSTTTSTTTTTSSGAKALSAAPKGVIPLESIISVDALSTEEGLRLGWQQPTASLASMLSGVEGSGAGSTPTAPASAAPPPPSPSLTASFFPSLLLPASALSTTPAGGSSGGASPTLPLGAPRSSAPSESSSLFALRLVGGRTLLVAAESPRARSAWITAISATKTHGELVTKAWSALGGDCAAEVVQLMSLANDWEDLILAGVGLDYVPEKSTLGLRASQRRLLERGGLGVPPQPVQDSSSSRSLGGGGGSAISALSLGWEGSGGGGGAGSSSAQVSGMGLLEQEAHSLAARALSGESSGVKERIANRARSSHAAGIEHRISGKVRAVLERAEAEVARREAATATAGRGGSSV